MAARTYPPIEQLAVIGDRRSAALVDAAGTIGWLCLPWYNSPPLLASLLDAARGGSWQVRIRGQRGATRHYAAREATHGLLLDGSSGALEVVDFLPWPQDDRAPEDEDRRLLVRLLRCTAGSVDVQSDLDVLRPATVEVGSQAADIRRDGQFVARLHASLALQPTAAGVGASGTIHEGDLAWIVLVAGDEDGAIEFDDATLEALLEETQSYWREWNARIPWHDAAADQVRDSATVLHLLTCAPAGATVAAPTTSLPERIGGERNWDYRYSWIRDASISLAMLAGLGRTDEARAYMDWIAGLGSGTAAPLQVVYEFNGGTELPERRLDGLEGYEGSLPIRIGNRANEQLQLDSMGYFADCAARYLAAGGSWDEGYWSMLRRAADFTAAHWQSRDSGIWELPSLQHWTSSKVMSWVVLDRAVRVAEQVGRAAADGWADAAEQIRTEVHERGWDERRSCFRQHYEGDDGVDASLLLIPLMGFLPPDDARVRGTVARVRAELERDRFVYRFDPAHTPGSESDLPMGEYEGAFLPCSCWLAAVLAMSGEVEEAERVLERVSAIAPTGLFAEEFDPRDRRMLGNMPLLFSHAELLRARRAVADARRTDGATA